MSPSGFQDAGSISLECFERTLYLINQRLQGLVIDSAFIHRSHADGVHTVLAGRGDEARQQSLAYTESISSSGIQASRTILICGPSRQFERLQSCAARDRAIVQELIDRSNAIASSGRVRPLLDLGAIGYSGPSFRPEAAGRDELQGRRVTMETDNDTRNEHCYRCLGFTYDDWMNANSPLTPQQRRILDSDAIATRPLRIVGPAGSGKTLLMQLLALKYIESARTGSNKIRVLYVTHNSAMAEKIRERFGILDARNFLKEEGRSLCVSTLSIYGIDELELQHANVIDNDAYQTKIFQLEQVKDAIRRSLGEHEMEVAKSQILKQVSRDDALFQLFARLVMNEISVAIKGHGLTQDRKRYVEAERSLSRLHGLLDAAERGIIWESFQHYHNAVFEQYEVLDTDDIALSLLGRLRTPIWELKRRDLGFDAVFVDEAQLFNENERRVFPLLTRGTLPHVPIVLALDMAQELQAMSSAGFASLGIRDITSESLPSIHRSSRQIIDLAFFIIQRTTDLFGPDFPDFSGATAQSGTESGAEQAIVPAIVKSSAESRNMGKFVLRQIRNLRSKNVQQIAVICHADKYWPDLERELQQGQLPEYRVLLQRGDRLPTVGALNVLTRPAHVGGQEFDAVIAVGLEQGLVPHAVTGNSALSSALEQQAFREMYLSFTRARKYLLIPISHDASATRILQEAANAGLIM